MEPFYWWPSERRFFFFWPLYLERTLISYGGFLLVDGVALVDWLDDDDDFVAAFASDGVVNDAVH